MYEPVVLYIDGVLDDQLRRHRNPTEELFLIGPDGPEVVSSDRAVELLVHVRHRPERV